MDRPFASHAGVRVFKLRPRIRLVTTQAVYGFLQLLHLLFLAFSTSSSFMFFSSSYFIFLLLSFLSLTFPYSCHHLLSLPWSSSSLFPCPLILVLLPYLQIYFHLFFPFLSYHSSEDSTARCGGEQEEKSYRSPKN
jgi:hypothetical protein